MKKINLFRKNYTVWGYELYNNFVIIYAYTEQPFEKYGTFGFLWWVELSDNVCYGDWITMSSENLTPSEKEKIDCFEVLSDQAKRSIDGALQGKNEDLKK